MADALAAPQPRMWGWRRGLVVAAALVVAGCQTMVPRGQAPVPQPRPQAPVDQQGPIGPELPQDQERHRIALLVPLSGSNAGVGQSIANAANLAVLDTGGKRIRMTTYDTATGASAAAGRAIADGNKLILGPLLADDARLIAPLARRARVPLISFSNDTTVAGGGTFILGYTPADSIDRVVRFARSKGLSRFAGLAPSGMYGQRASTSFIRAVESAGGQVVTLQSFDRSRASIGAAVTRMAKDSAYDAILIADGGRIAMQAAPLIRRGGGAGAQLLGTELWNTDPTITSSPTLSGAWFASVSDNLYRQLVVKYRARYGSAPYRIASMGYDSVLLVTRIAQDWRVGSDFPITRLTDAGGFTGIDGAFRFREDGTAERALVVQQVGSGATSIVSPAPAQFDR